ncbi:MAG: DUF4912 domain-containing protein [Deltaproteobacteria bacterium]|nr:DUF4912 domain-containing protein [Deltaproteobacteria bacterium]
MKKLESKTVRELVELARQWGISGYSKMKKAELVNLLAKKIPGGKRGEAQAQPARSARKAASKARVKPVGSAARKAYVRPEARSRPADAPRRAGAVEPRESREINRPWPQSSLEGRMILLTRDPHWLYCYWDLSSEQAHQLWKGHQAVLRVVELGDHEDPREVSRFEVPIGARSWYIQVEAAGRTYRCELGQVLPDGEFETLLHSNLSDTPPDHLSEGEPAVYRASPPVDTRLPDSLSAPFQADQKPSSERLFELSTGAKGFDSAEAVEALHRRMQAGLASELLHSAVHAAGSEHVGRTGSEEYWLWVDADLIVYGATVPGSRVTLKGVDLPLDEHGRFSARFALPDGNLQIPVKGVSPTRRFRKRGQLDVKRTTEMDAQPRRVELA